MKTKLFPLPLLVALLLACTCKPALALTVPVYQDTSSDKAGALTSANGKATSLSVTDDQTALIEFDLSNLNVVPAVIDPSNIASAILNLYVIKASPPGDLNVLIVTGTWDETFAAKTEPLPAVDSTNVLATIPAAALPTRTKGFVSVNITGAVAAALASGSNLSIAVETTTPGAKVTLGSKDGPSLGYAAYLDIESGSSTVAIPLVVGTVTSGTVPEVTLADTSTDQELDFTLVPGVQGIPGMQGNPGISGSTGPAGPADDLTIGTVTSGTAIGVAISGTSPDQTLNFMIPNGQLPNEDTAVGYDALISEVTGSSNTAIGYQALFSNTAGYKNTAIGYLALYSNTGGNLNTATGNRALYNNTNGDYNMANGYDALSNNTTGSNNTACGYNALFANTTGTDNSATGYQALYLNTTGSDNAANGYKALYSNTVGYHNTAIGTTALTSNTTGYEDTAEGDSALGGNTEGYQNTANGNSSLINNTKGYENTAMGHDALFTNTAGANNTAIGEKAGYRLTTGSNNIDIGDYNPVSGNPDDIAGEQNTIRIGGSSTQTATYIAGIWNQTSSGGAAVYINPNGRLGTLTSSRRFKQNIESMDDASDVLLSLRPVTFQYKPEIDPKGTPQFGLIAEEVEKACPDLVVHDKDGKVYTVRYEAVNAMLLNEFLKEHRRVAAQGETDAELMKRVAVQERTNTVQAQTIAEQQKQIETLTASLAKMTQQIDAVAQRVEGRDYMPAANHIDTVPGD